MNWQKQYAAWQGWGRARGGKQKKRILNPKRVFQYMTVSDHMRKKII